MISGAYRGADLHKVLANRLTVVHGVEGRNLVNAHWGHLEHASDLVHDADAGEAVLALTEVKQRHDSSLLVLGRVALEDLIGECEVLFGKLEREGRVVVGLVAVLLETITVSIWISDSPILRRNWRLKHRRGRKEYAPPKGSR